MTRKEIETKIRVLQEMLAEESHPSTLATINRCLVRLIMMNAEDE